uniref:hypothetical protein n=1 Tax=Alistipes sp. TaxID=1872444 RepID=UPI0040567D39
MSVRSDIIAKAFVYLDEVSAHQDEVNASAFPCEKLLDESGEWVLRVVPLHALGEGKRLCCDSLKANADGTGSLTLPADFVRLLSFRLSDWKRPVLSPILESDPRYMHQYDPILRGGPSKPVVVICNGNTEIRYFTSSLGEDAKVVDARYVGYSVVTDSFPKRLRDILAWRLAEQVSWVMGDADTAQICAAKSKEMINAL